MRREDNLKDALTLAELTRDEHLAILAEAEMRETFDLMWLVTQQLMPQRLQRDQDVYVVYLRDGIGFGGRYGQAVEQGDLVAAHLNTTDLFLARTKMLTNISTVFCERAIVAESRALCRSAIPPGGAYGADLRLVFRRLSSDLLPSIEFYPSQYSPEEAASAFAAILEPRIFTMMEGAFDSVQQLEPPAHLRLDHDRINRHLADTLDAALAMGATTENQNVAATGVDFGVLERLRRDAADDLSAEAKTIVAPYFHE